MGDIIPGQLKRSKTANTRLGILGEWSKAVELFEDSEVGMSALNGFETAEVLIMLVKASDHQLGGIVRGWDGVAANRVAQFGPVTFKEIKDDKGIGRSCDKSTF